MAVSVGGLVEGIVGGLFAALFEQDSRKIKCTLAKKIILNLLFKKLADISNTRIVT